MAGFIGELGGLLMIALIIVLLYMFIAETGADKDKVFGKKIGRYAVPAILLGVLQLIIGGLIFSFFYGYTSVFNIREIWTFNPFGSTFAVVGDYSTEYLSEQGMMPLYFVLVKLFGQALYKMFDQCAFYISFLSGVVTYVSVGLLLERDSEDIGTGDTVNGNDRTKQMYGLFLCVPGSVFMFLPSAFSLCLALMSVFLYVWNYGRGNKIAAFVLALLCVLTHFSGIVALVLLMAGLLYRADGLTAVIRDAAVIAVVQAVVIAICVYKGWGSLYEYIMMYPLPAIMILNKCRVNISDAVNSLVNLVLVLISGFWITGAITSVI